MGERTADEWGGLGLRRLVSVLDAFLAATAITHDLIVVSREEDGFRNTGARRRPVLEILTQLEPNN